MSNDINVPLIVQGTSPREGLLGSVGGARLISDVSVSFRKLLMVYACFKGP